MSSTVIVVELISVVVPLTVRFPVIVTVPSAAIVILSEPPVSKRMMSSSEDSSTCILVSPSASSIEVAEKSEVRATVPVSFGKVIVRSAVGSVTVNVVS